MPFFVDAILTLHFTAQLPIAQLPIGCPVALTAAQLVLPFIRDLWYTQRADFAHPTAAFHVCTKPIGD